MDVKNKYNQKFLVFVFLSLCWICSQTLSLIHYGFREGGDTGRYLSGANMLINGKLPVDDQLSYLGYDMFVALCLFFGGGEVGVVLVQMALTAIAAYCIFKTGETLFDYRSGAIASFAYIAYPPIHEWDFFILTDSLFTTMLIISTWCLIKSKTNLVKICTVLIFLFTFIIRPNGIILIGAFLVFYLYTLWSNGQKKLFICTLISFLLLFTLIVNYEGSIFKHITIVKYYSDGIIIGKYDKLHLTMENPGLSALITETKSPLMQIFYFIIEKPIYFSELFFYKIWYFLIHTRPFYSTFHNLFVLVTLMPAYFFVLWGLKRKTKHENYKLFIFAIIFFQTLNVGLTVADWDGRFLEVVLPQIFLLASGGFNIIFDMSKKYLYKYSGRLTSLRPPT